MGVKSAPENLTVCSAKLAASLAGGPSQPRLDAVFAPEIESSPSWTQFSRQEVGLPWAGFSFLGRNRVLPEQGAMLATEIESW